MTRRHSVRADGDPPRRGAIPVWLPLLGCTSLSVLSTGLYTPSLPHLPDLLVTDPATVQLTMSLNLLAFSLAQLVHGPMADRFGRKRMLSVGLGCFVVASLACAMATGIGGLLTARILQGTFASVSSVVVAVIIREYYGGTRAVEVMGLFGLTLGLVPAMGPVIGGYVFVFMGWRANFYILAGLAIVMALLVTRSVPETGDRERRPLTAAGIFREYASLLRNRRYTAYLVPLAGAFGALFAFVTASPFVLIDGLGVATQHYGFAMALPVTAFMAGSWTANRLAGHVAVPVQVRRAIYTASGGALTVLVPALAGQGHLAGVLIGMAIFEFGLGVLLAAGYVGLLDAVAGSQRGAASALAGSTQVAGASLAGFLVGAFHDGSAVPMGATSVGLCGLGLLGWILLGHTRASASRGS